MRAKAFSSQRSRRRCRARGRTQHSAREILLYRQCGLCARCAKKSCQVISRNFREKVKKSGPLPWVSLSIHQGAPRSGGELAGARWIAGQTAARGPPSFADPHTPLEARPPKTPCTPAGGASSLLFFLFPPKQSSPSCPWSSVASASASPRRIGSAPARRSSRGPLRAPERGRGSLVFSPLFSSPQAELQSRGRGSLVFSPVSIGTPHTAHEHRPPDT